MDSKQVETLVTGTAEVMVHMVTTVTVPTDAQGHWLESDAVAGALWAADQGRASWDVKEVTPTGAPAAPPQRIADGDQVTQDLATLAGLDPDEVTAWTPGKRI